MMITGQGNGQGGREVGQKANQLPGYRHIDVLEERQYIADVWGIPEPELADLAELLRRRDVAAGEVLWRQGDERVGMRLIGEGRGAGWQTAGGPRRVRCDGGHVKAA